MVLIIHEYKWSSTRVLTQPALCLSYRCSLSKDANQFFDADTGVLEAPVEVHVSGQVRISKSSCTMLAYATAHSLCPILSLREAAEGCNPVCW